MFNSNVQPRRRSLRVRRTRWTCPACKLRNPSWAATCLGCNTRAPRG